MKRLLLLSNSTLSDEQFLGWPEPYIMEFLGPEKLKILFFPFAAVTFSFEEYYDKVAERFGQMGHETFPAHHTSDKKSALEQCDATVVGGGNTFQLIDHLQDGWLGLIRNKVESGTPYIGWSAGANVACPTIKTTNDMPIVQPKSFEALNFVNFQINPHYTEASLPNHGGETRPLRIREFLEVNPGVKVLGVPEGALLQVEGTEVFYKGSGELAVFEKGQAVRYEGPGRLDSHESGIGSR